MITVCYKVLWIFAAEIFLITFKEKTLVMNETEVMDLGHAFTLTILCSKVGTALEAIV